MLSSCLRYRCSFCIKWLTQYKRLNQLYSYHTTLQCIHIRLDSHSKPFHPRMKYNQYGRYQDKSYRK